MATIQEIIERVDDTKPNAFTQKTKMAWIAELDGRIASDIMLMGLAEIGRFEYRHPEDLTSEPLICFPHNRLYDLWLGAQIDFENGEYNKYQNSMEFFNAAYGSFLRWFSSRYEPAQGLPGGEKAGGYYITAYGLAVKQGFKGTLGEWLKSLTGDKGDKTLLRYQDGMVQWCWTKAAGDAVNTEWYDLVDIAMIREDILAEAVKEAVAKSSQNAVAAKKSAAEAQIEATAAAASAENAAAFAETAEENANSAKEHAEAAAEAAVNAAAFAETAEENANSAKEHAEAAAEAAKESVPISGGEMTGRLRTPSGFAVYGASWPTIQIEDLNGNLLGMMQISDAGKLTLGHRAPGATYGERYALPVLTADRTAEGWYSILTSKNPVTIAQGGHGASNGADGLKNLLAAGPTVLSSNQYGDTLPAAGTKGRIFFKKV